MNGVIIIPEFIFEDKDLNYAQMMLFWLILKLANNSQKKCNATNEELGDVLNSKDRTIRANLKLLARRGYINIEWQKIATDGKKLPPQNTNWELKKTARFISLGKKLPPYIYNIYSNTTTSSKKEERNRKKEEMLEAFRNDDRFKRFINEEDAIIWWEHKQASKKPYKDVNSFITALVKIMNVIKKYWDMPKSDRDRKNRFNYAVNEAIEKGWEWLNWYDSMEQVYESSRDDLYPNQKQNE